MVRSRRALRRQTQQRHECRREIAREHQQDSVAGADAKAFKEGAISRGSFLPRTTLCPSPPLLATPCDRSKGKISPCRQEAVEVTALCHLRMQKRSAPSKSLGAPNFQ